jgi:hypothetical protein
MQNVNIIWTKKDSYEIDGIFVGNKTEIVLHVSKMQ